MILENDDEDEEKNGEDGEEVYVEVPLNEEHLSRGVRFFAIVPRLSKEKKIFTITRVYKRCKVVYEFNGLHTYEGLLSNVKPIGSHQQNEGMQNADEQFQTILTVKDCGTADFNGEYYVDFAHENGFIQGKRCYRKKGTSDDAIESTIEWRVYAGASISRPRGSGSWNMTKNYGRNPYYATRITCFADSEKPPTTGWKVEGQVLNPPPKIEYEDIIVGEKVRIKNMGEEWDGVIGVYMGLDETSQNHIVNVNDVQSEEDHGTTVALNDMECLERTILLPRKIEIGDEVNVEIMPMVFVQGRVKSTKTTMTVNWGEDDENSNHIRQAELRRLLDSTSNADGGSSKEYHPFITATGRHLNEKEKEMDPEKRPLLMLMSTFNNHVESAKKYVLYEYSNSAKYKQPSEDSFPRGGITCVGCGGTVECTRVGALDKKDVDRFKKTHYVGKPWKSLLPCLQFSPRQLTLSRFSKKRVGPQNRSRKPKRRKLGSNTEDPDSQIMKLITTVFEEEKTDEMDIEDLCKTIKEKKEDICVDVLISLFKNSECSVVFGFWYAPHSRTVFKLGSNVLD